MTLKSKVKKQLTTDIGQITILIDYIQNPIKPYETIT
jgi:hypothetical protein